MPLLYQHDSSRGYICGELNNLFTVVLYRRLGTKLGTGESIILDRKILDVK